jgi:hypothetical protein
MWQTNSNFVRPNLSIEGAHVKGTDTGGLVFSIDGRTVLTRGGDDTVKRDVVSYANGVCSDIPPQFGICVHSRNRLRHDHN